MKKIYRDIPHVLIINILKKKEKIASLPRWIMFLSEDINYLIKIPMQTVK